MLLGIEAHTALDALASSVHLVVPIILFRVNNQGIGIATIATLHYFLTPRKVRLIDTFNDGVCLSLGLRV